METFLEQNLILEMLKTGRSYWLGMDLILLIVCLKVVISFGMPLLSMVHLMVLMDLINAHL